jgi:hypothetical protein
MRPGTQRKTLPRSGAELIHRGLRSGEAARAGRRDRETAALVSRASRPPRDGAERAVQPRPRRRRLRPARHRRPRGHLLLAGGDRASCGDLGARHAGDGAAHPGAAGDGAGVRACGVGRRDQVSRVAALSPNDGLDEWPRSWRAPPRTIAAIRADRGQGTPSRGRRTGRLRLPSQWNRPR